MTFDTADTGATYTLTSSSGTITVLDGFSGQTWSSSLSTVTNIPTSVTTIGNNAFNTCISLSSITIPNSVTSFLYGTFYNCTSLSTITIPSSLTSLGLNTFYSCTSLSSILVDPSNLNFSSLDVNLYDLAQTIIIQYAIGKTATSFSIPSTVTDIGFGAFNSASYLTSITIPNGVTLIGEDAFKNCTSLASITIPNSVTTIQNFVFYNCTSLTSITIPNSVTSIGAVAFYGIPNLSSTIVTTPITPTPSYAYTWFHTEPDFTNYYSNITFQDPNPGPIICFKEDTKILTDKGYTPIQNLRNGDLVKTINHNYVPINMIGKREIHHSALKERIKDQLYKCSQTDYPEIFEDLIITGCHAILVDEFKAGEREKTIEVLDRIFVTDRKYRLPACVDERASVYEVSGYYTIYHIALDNDDSRMNYGIYANGLLVESCSKRHMKELSKMELL
jgi:hypothetical protein